ncbi:sulfotransferase domain-containing protein [Paenibacillus hexagrammi]|uniref:Sulfotransferase domain-containing protein n=1 Tax=Paenibacillus hexagrammi TaxID=2908839 RepID=A0ABY3SS29_9BACL|nr:sulfotransferase domain-containing protein [Paenibacillus sp. YPD9-1]UJF35787.1 sulfotransferase domain-containing protein [Paenibacillus sp. YPD9-1]
MEQGEQTPVILLNTVPKSGTNLLNQIVLGVPGTVLQSTVLYEGEPEHMKLQFPILENAKPNEVYMGHLYYSKMWSNFLREKPIRTVFMIRDLRDVLVSLAYYIVKSVPHYPIYQDLISLQSQKERYLLLIDGIRDYPNIRQWFALFTGWLHEDDVLTITYEQLMTSAESRKRTILRIAEHIWKDRTPTMPLEKLANEMEKNIDSKVSSTFRKGVVGGWKEEFDEEVKMRFTQVAGELLIQTGYEKDLNW